MATPGACLQEPFGLVSKAGHSCPSTPMSCGADGSPAPGWRRAQLAILATMALLIAASPADAHEFSTAWKGSRRWIGPEFWASSLADWRIEDGEVVANPGPDRKLHWLTGTTTGLDSFTLESVVRLAGKSKPESPPSWAGFRFGLSRKNPEPRSVLSPDVIAEGIEGGLRSNGKLFLGASEAEAAKLVAGPTTLRIEVTISGETARLVLRAEGQKARAEVSADFPAAAVAGDIALVSSSAANIPGEPAWRFRSFKATGPGLVDRPGLAFGPVLWTQYTTTGHTLRLLAHFAPVETKPAPEARLEWRAGPEWIPALSSPIDARTHSALFRFEAWDASRPVDYRVVLRWQDQDHEWRGTIRAEPKDPAPIALAVLSGCDLRLFPFTRLVDQLRDQDPDLVCFAGHHLDFRPAGSRASADDLWLDYLTNLHRFGWVWRDLLKDRPCLIRPDTSGLPPSAETKTNGPSGQSNAPKQPTDLTARARFVQTAHMPEAAAPALPEAKPGDQPALELTYGGIPMIVLDGETFRTPPETALAGLDRATLAPAQTDVESAELLGPEQEEFLGEWARRTNSAPFRIVLAGLPFCQNFTHEGPSLTESSFSLDCAGWPKHKRDKILESLQEAPTLVVHPGGAPGMVLQYGFGAFDDGPMALVVPALAGAALRGWWPPDKPGSAAAGVGRFTDPFGNRFTAWAAANPQRAVTELDPATAAPDLLAALRGSGYGIIGIDTAQRKATLTLWIHPVAMAAPARFPGFPVVLPFRK